MFRKKDRFLKKNPYPLTYALYNSKAIAILRNIYQTGQYFNSRQLARVCGLSHQTCADIVEELVRLNMVQAIRSGPAVFISLNKENAIISELILPLLDKEWQMIVDIQRELNKEFGETCDYIIQKDIFSGVGSINLVTRKDLEEVKKKAEIVAEGLNEIYDFCVKINVYDYATMPLDLR